MKLEKQSGYSCVRCAAMVIGAAILVVTSGGSALASGPLEKTIYAFPSAPVAGLIADKNGNLYGTTQYGGKYQHGTVFELSPPATAGGEWTETELHAFQGFLGDGGILEGSLILDKLGNLYGTTASGGSAPGHGGIVFELSPPATTGEAWTETILYNFSTNSVYGDAPVANLVFDADGNLYGTNFTGGKNNYNSGTVFELSRPATQGGAWTITLVHAFTQFNGTADGAYPRSGLVFDRRGALYGTTSIGGTGNNGIVFQLVRERGVWTENVLYTFPAGGLGDPVGGVILDSAGNLYGTAQVGGILNCHVTEGCGGVFELSPPTTVGDPWTENTLYLFSGGRDGGNPAASLLRDKVGNLYGTASWEGLANKVTRSNGTVFELSPSNEAGGAWTETTLHEFGGPAYHDGSRPVCSLVALKGKLYGTTESTAFSLTLP